tara:strand:- start:2041 stop:3174 length:1134 start_codon:yes stop_codon:yes gene_type:complete
MKITFLCFDLSNNSLGRTAILARALSKRYEIEIIGPAKNNQIWEPMKNSGLPIRVFPWRRLPSFAHVMKEMIRAIDGDIVYACKPRLSSYGVGLLSASGKPLILDIDDWELGFFYRAGFWGRVGRFFNLSNPDGLPFTWLMEQRADDADAITVSNKFLQIRFGGDLIYHCRDTNDLDPARYDRNLVKLELGLIDKKILMFLGTPRAHKGVDDLVEMMRLLKNPSAHLVIVGLGYSETKKFLDPELKKKISLVPKVPFEKLGNYLASADVVVIPQRATRDTEGQMPAKIFDAMAMAKPVVSTKVSDIPQVLGKDGYLIEPDNPSRLAETVDHILENEKEAYTRGLNLRERCRQFYDSKIMEEKLASVVKRAIVKNKLK